MRNVIIKKKCLLFKHEKNNQTLSNDWPSYCHTGIHIHYRNSVVMKIKLTRLYKCGTYTSKYYTNNIKQIIARNTRSSI